MEDLTSSFRFATNLSGHFHRLQEEEPVETITSVSMALHASMTLDGPIS